MHRKPTVVVATSVSAALLAVSTSFAVANGVFGSRRSDRVGSFQEINARLAPATRRIASHPAAPNASQPAVAVATNQPGTAAAQPAVNDEPARAEQPRSINTTTTRPHREQDDDHDNDGGRGRDD